MTPHHRKINVLWKIPFNTCGLRGPGFSLAAVTLFFGIAFGGAALAQTGGAKVVDAAYHEIMVDGDTSDWAKLPSGVVTMDTKGRGSNGTLAVDIKYAWDYTNVYILVMESTNQVVAQVAQEAPDVTAYQATPWTFDTIGFWLDLNNNAGTTNETGDVVVENNADFQPWFGFSSTAQTDLMFARVNDSTTPMDLAELPNARVATGGTFAGHDRRIEVALAWADMASVVEAGRQPGGDLPTAIMPGYTFGSEPLLVYNDFNAQAFIGDDPGNPPSGVDANSRDIRLVESVKVVDAAFSSEIKVDGDSRDWANLQSGVVTMDTQGRGTNGTLAIDILYAWNQTNLYVLVKENTNNITATTNNIPSLQAQEAPNAEAYQNGAWFFDSIGFWFDLDNNAGTVEDGAMVVENNADYQPWFGFSSSGRTDLIYGRLNDSSTMNLEGLQNARIATGGTFTSHDRVIEIALPWADLAATVDVARQPGGDLVNAIKPGYTFGSEPLLINNEYNGQAFIGPLMYFPGNGIDIYSRDIRLAAVAVALPALAIQAQGNQVIILWPVSATGFELESSIQLGTGAVWSKVTTNPTVENGMNKVAVAITTGPAFYRLRK
jgi:hypothetical protein